jgi:hypothetical protein
MTRTEMVRSPSLLPRHLAAIAGAAYLVTDAMAIFSEFFVRPMLIVGDDAARTASNIVAHAQLFRAGIVSDLLTGAGVVILNLALYELLEPVHPIFARLALFWRLVEVSVLSTITLSGLGILALLSGADYLQAFSPGELHGLARLLVAAQASGYMIVLLFFGLGSTTYMVLLVRSHYVPKPLALLALGGSAMVMLFALARILFPTVVLAPAAAVRELPPLALAALAVIFLPVLSFEIILGFWLLVKGVRIPELARRAEQAVVSTSAGGDAA